jgi:hypothetical protein
MTTGTSAGAGRGSGGGAAGPPVGVRLSVPDAWQAIDLDPATSDASIDAYVAACVAAAPEAARHRGRMRGILREVVAANRAGGAFFTAFLAGTRGRPEDVVGASLVVAWHALDGAGRISVDGLVEILAAAPPEAGERVARRVVARVQLGCGPAAYLQTSQLVPVPRATERQRVTISQFLVPVRDLPWLAVVTASTPNLDLADGVDAIAEGVAQSLRFTDPPAEPAAPATGDQAPDG